MRLLPLVLTLTCLFVEQLPGRGAEPLDGTGTASAGAIVAIPDRFSGGGRLPNIREPGPDAPDFPDSPYTVPPGIVYLETSLTLVTMDWPRLREYATATLIRIGLVEDWELRLSSPGLIVRVGPPDSTSGFGPITIGAKHHLFNGSEDECWPAVGLIMQITTRTGADAFRPGIAEPAIFCNFDHTLPWGMEFEWNAGVSLRRNEAGHSQLQAQLLFALTRPLGEELRLFAHGFFFVPASSGNDAELVIGPGVLWIISDRVAMDASISFGLTEESPDAIARIGVSLAF